eukprot:TRINITY_DN5184_c0_g1_i2.p1 TRINITY_DN5184_c0_g1~~TRINITY_DN5184_c0_g1_i2.p1  ORF type:complete len:232 (+),score=38.02 TRINITY_DN5184_c0_g1_i2:144-839(+)
MILYKELERKYDLGKAKNVISTPKLKVVQTVRKEQPINEILKNEEVVIKTLRGIEIGLNDPQTMIECIRGIFDGVLTSYRAQCDLTVNIEAVCLVPAEGNEDKDKLFLDQIIVMEYFGEDLTNLIKAGVKWKEDNVDKLVRFLIRALRMMKQRGVIHGDIKPANIVCNEALDFRLSELESSGFFSRNSTVTMSGYTECYASTLVKTKIALGQEVTTQEWRTNDLYLSLIHI